MCGCTWFLTLIIFVLAGSQPRHVVQTAAPEVSAVSVQQQRQQQQALELQEARQSLASRLAASDLITQPLQLNGRELKGEFWAHDVGCTTVAYLPPSEACWGLALL